MEGDIFLIVVSYYPLKAYATVFNEDSFLKV